MRRILVDTVVAAQVTQWKLDYPAIRKRGFWESMFFAPVGVWDFWVIEPALVLQFVGGSVTLSASDAIKANSILVGNPHPEIKAVIDRFIDEVNAYGEALKGYEESRKFYIGDTEKTH